MIPHPMYYGSTTRGTGFKPEGWRRRLLRRLFFFLPRGNPDNEPLYPRVSRWLLEIDEDGHPFREIGMDEGGTPLFAAPNERNFGFFTDSDAKFAREDLQLVEREVFEKIWKAVKGESPDGR
jgi:hypothetical protein